MWVPEHFKSLAPSWPAELVDAHPFALLVTVSNGAPLATHVPVIIEPEDRRRADEGLEGVRILGHLARENSHWRDTEEGSEALLVIGGPNAYVSPAAYSDLPAAPTWNYLAVHASGPIRWIHEPEGMMRIIDLTIDRTEANEGTRWDREPSRPYFERILHGIVGFEIAVEHSKDTFKLSQDQPPHRREEVVSNAEARGCGHYEAERELLEWTRRANPEVFGGERPL